MPLLMKQRANEDDYVLEKKCISVKDMLPHKEINEERCNQRNKRNEKQSTPTQVADMSTYTSLKIRSSICNSTLLARDGQ